MTAFSRCDSPREFFHPVDEVVAIEAFQGAVFGRSAIFKFVQLAQDFEPYLISARAINLGHNLRQLLQISLHCRKVLCPRVSRNLETYAVAQRGDLVLDLDPVAMRNAQVFRLKLPDRDLQLRVFAVGVD